MTKDNIQLGKFDLTGIPPAPRGVPQIQVTFEINADGILNVGAKDDNTGNEESITITADKGRPSQEDIDEMLKAAKEFEEQDKLMRETIESKNKLESTAFSLKSQIEDEEKLGGRISEDDKEAIEEAVEDVINWLMENDDADKESYDEKLEELNEVVQPIVQSAGAAGGGAGAGGEDDDSFDDHDEL